MNVEKRSVSETTDGQEPRSGFEDAGAPAPFKSNGQYEAYWVLNKEKRAKGFVRPLRHSYQHVGPIAPVHPLRELTPDEVAQYSKYGYVKYEEYPSSESLAIGRYWTQRELDRSGKGCGTVTTMGQAIAETYACDPHYYGWTFCCHCSRHFPVSEFTWSGTQERVGT